MIPELTIAYKGDASYSVRRRRLVRLVPQVTDVVPLVILIGSGEPPSLGPPSQVPKSPRSAEDQEIFRLRNEAGLRNGVGWLGMVRVGWFFQSMTNNQYDE